MMGVDTVNRESKGSVYSITLQKEVERFQPLLYKSRYSIVFFFLFAYSRVLAASPHGWRTQAINVSALSSIYSLRRIMAYLLGTFSNGGQYRSVKVIFKYCNTLWELSVEI